MTKQKTVLAKRAVIYYKKYKKAMSELYEIDELEGEKVDRYIDEQL